MGRLRTLIVPLVLAVVAGACGPREIIRPTTSQVRHDPLKAAAWLADRIPEESLSARAFGVVAQAHARLNEADEARRRLEQGVDVLEDVEPRERRLFAIGALCRAALEAGDTAQGKRLHELAKDLTVHVQGPRFTGMAIVARAQAARAAGDSEDAARWLARIDAPHLRAGLLLTLADAALRRGDTATAGEDTKAAQALQAGIEDPTVAAIVLMRVARMLQLLGRPDEAIAAEQAADRAVSGEDADAYARVVVKVGAAALNLARKQPDAAAAALSSIEAALEDIDAARKPAAYADAAKVLARLGDVERAKRYAATAREALAIGLPPLAREAATHHLAKTWVILDESDEAVSMTQAIDDAYLSVVVMAAIAEARTSRPVGVPD